jgi:hypothetical protein
MPAAQSLLGMPERCSCFNVRAAASSQHAVPASLSARTAGPSRRTETDPLPCKRGSQGSSGMVGYRVGAGTRLDSAPDAAAGITNCRSAQRRFSCARPASCLHLQRMRRWPRSVLRWQQHASAPLSRSAAARGVTCVHVRPSCQDHASLKCYSPPRRACQGAARLSLSLSAMPLALSQ